MSRRHALTDDEKLHIIKELSPERAAKVEAGTNTLATAWTAVIAVEREKMVKEGKAFPKHVKEIVRKGKAFAKVLEEHREADFTLGHWAGIWKVIVRINTAEAPIIRRHHAKGGSFL